MTNASSNASPPRPPTEEAPRSPRPRVPHPRETRIGLVLYGGVALAVYINGVVQELFRLATEGDGPYADLRDRLGTDVVIDIISGTSAGGVNGVFLAKALTQGASLEGLKTLWKTDADFAELLRKPDEKEPLSLLSSQTYHEKLRKALAGMKGTGASSVDELDLFVTATDFEGQRKTFQDALGEPLHARDHRRVIHLQYREGRRARPSDPPPPPRKDDFRAEMDELLAHASRATSAFPGAFEATAIPATAVPDDPPGSGKRPARFRDLIGRYLVDGGVLDNKPFGYALRAIAERPIRRVHDRILFFVEPDPEAIEEPVGEADSAPPDFLQVLTRALLTIRPYESIAGDLEELDRMNRRAEAVEGLLRSAREALAREEVAEMPELSLLADGYRGLRVRSLARFWAEGATSDPERQRRLEELYIRGLGGPEKASLASLDGQDPLFVARLAATLRARIDACARELRAERGEDVARDEAINRLLAGLAEIVGKMFEEWRGHTARMRSSKERGRLAFAPRALGDSVGSAREGIRGLMRSEGVDALPESVRRELRATEERFERLDQVQYPLLVLAGLVHHARIRLKRISPADAKAVAPDLAPRDKLAGEVLGHFGGFLQRAWRENDILWGRLDAAEVVVKTLWGPPRDAADEKRRDDLLHGLLVGIVKEELSENTVRHIQEGFFGEAEARLAAGAERSTEGLKKLMAVLRAKLDAKDQAVLDHAIDVERLYEAFRVQARTGRQTVSDLDADRSLSLLAHASGVTIRMLSGAWRRREAQGTLLGRATKCLAVLVTIFQVLVEAMVGKCLKRRLYSAALVFAFLFSTMVLVVAPLVGVDLPWKVVIALVAMLLLPLLAFARRALR